MNTPQCYVCRYIASLVFAEMEFVYCTVKTESLNIMQLILSLKKVSKKNGCREYSHCVISQNLRLPCLAHNCDLLRKRADLMLLILCTMKYTNISSRRIANLYVFCLSSTTTPQYC